MKTDLLILALKLAAAGQIKAGRTAIHWIVFLSYAGFTATYLKAALG